MLRNYIKPNIRHLKKGNILGILVANAQVCKIENIKTSLRQRLLKPQTWICTLLEYAHTNTPKNLIFPTQKSCHVLRRNAALNVPK